MPDSYVDTVLATGDDLSSVSFPIAALNSSYVKYRVYRQDGTIEENAFGAPVITGSSGAWTVDCGTSSVAAAYDGDTLRIYRQTPRARLVDFNAGTTLTEEDLDTTSTQDQHIQEELTDQVSEALVLLGGFFDAGLAEVRNLGAPLSSSSAARLQDVQDAVFDAGSLPSVTDLYNGYMLLVQAGSWGLASPSTVRTAIGLGTAAVANTGTGASNVPTITNADSRYLRISNVLSELTASAATARSNLGLGSAATKNAGSAAGEVLQILSGPALPAVNGDNLTFTTASPFYNPATTAIMEWTVGQDIPQDSSGITGGTWNSNAANQLALSALTGVNWSGKVTIGSNRFTLQPGDWELTVFLHLLNIHPSTSYRIRWVLVQNPTGSPSYSVGFYANAPFASNDTLQDANADFANFVEPITFSLASATDFEIRAATTGGAGTVKLLKGKVLARLLV